MTTKPDRSKCFDQALGDDRRHEFIGVVDALAALKAQCERERVGDVFSCGRREPFGRVGHRGSIARGETDNLTSAGGLHCANAMTLA
jgi:hypothetical protein